MGPTPHFDKLKDLFFRASMKNSGWIFKEGETATEYIWRTGFPFQIRYGKERHDN